MSRTPETITNVPAQVLRAILIGLGIFFALAALGGYHNDGAVFLPATISLGAFIIAANIKVTWRKKAEVGAYK